ncbi:hypothetical protein [Sinomicrobium soli]|uniref:hypothetical protein n=1 Tax=Sinomicrobium sp. N-1-3-6 TaxID=2219864 RepID=UPI000DCDE5FA|nr:hypothetical protein [Sinomicrobium sp. N-1-3-6]RAV28073.1 hypothetical protein DN748_15345 [Sinomicrobium sp. N-1-3-6]
MKINSLFSALFAVLVCASCSEERDLTYQGEDVVEFSNPITGLNEKLTGPSIGGKSREGDNPDIPIRGTQDSVVVQLVGRQKDSPVIIHYTIEGTAVEGEDFEIIGDKGIVAIPANSSSAAIRFSLLNHSEDPSDIREVTFTMESVEDETAGISENYHSFTVSIFPMLAYVDAGVSESEAFFSTRNGETYSGISAPETVDVAFGFGEDQISLVSPLVHSGDVTASDTKYSERVFTPPSDAPDYLLAAYATDQLGDITSEDVAEIPVSGTTAGAAVHTETAIEVNGIYGFVNGAGKKGYIRIKSVEGDQVIFDVMAQP